MWDIVVSDYTLFERLIGFILKIAWDWKIDLFFS